MTWFLFMDESGHDHKNMPYEVRGGIALHVGELWPFAQSIKHEEKRCFGSARNNPKYEMKGGKFLNRARIQLAQQGDLFSDEERQRLCNKLLAGEPSSLDARIAYAQACLKMTDSLFSLLEKHKAHIFATAIPRGAKPPIAQEKKFKDFLRKDHVFLLERYFYFLEGEKDHGVLVMDESEKRLDRDFVARMEKYFTRTQTGRGWRQWIAPIPFFVSSDMNYPVQVADICLYCINWGYRNRNMNAPPRQDMVEYGKRLRQLTRKGYNIGIRRSFFHQSIVYVPDPYAGRT